MNENEQKFQIALTLLKGIGFEEAKKILSIDTLSAFFSSTKMDLVHRYGIQPTAASALYEEFSTALKVADKEYEHCLKNNIKSLFFTDDDYPYRLLECYDAPLLLYTKSNTSFNQGKFISIVGTRNATYYGKQQCQQLVYDLANQLQNIIIISGLAYGIDITAHKAALEMNIPTIAVLAGGLHRIYPAVHRPTADKMLNNGAIITEQPYQTPSEKRYFLQRNRIIAGMSDAVVVAESAAKGGALVTASIATTYNKDVFVFPGRVNDAASAGCNALIKHHKATLIENADDLCYFMGWNTATKKKKEQKQKYLDGFDRLNPQEKSIIQFILQEENVSIDKLSYLTNIRIEDLLPILLMLEFQNYVVCLPGNRYQIK